MKHPHANQRADSHQECRNDPFHLISSCPLNIATSGMEDGATIANWSDLKHLITTNILEAEVQGPCHLNSLLF